jgi:hypothetical protein
MCDSYQLSLYKWYTGIWINSLLRFVKADFQCCVFHLFFYALTFTYGVVKHGRGNALIHVCCAESVEIARVSRGIQEGKKNHGDKKILKCFTTPWWNGWVDPGSTFYTRYKFTQCLTQSESWVEITWKFQWRPFWFSYLYLFYAIYSIYALLEKNDTCVFPATFTYGKNRLTENDQPLQ